MPGKVKLTEAQTRILSRMDSGDEVWTTGGGDPSAFWHGNLSDRRPSFASLHVLQKTGFIANYDARTSGKKYRITASGRAHLSSGRE